MLTFCGMNLDSITLYFFFYEGSDSESLTWYCIQVSYKLDDKTLETENLVSLKLVCFALIFAEQGTSVEYWSFFLLSKRSNSMHFPSTCSKHIFKWYGGPSCVPAVFCDFDEKGKCEKVSTCNFENGSHVTNRRFRTSMNQTQSKASAQAGFRGHYNRSDIMWNQSQTSRIFRSAITRNMIRC